MPETMTGAELADTLAALYWSKLSLAQMLGCDESSVRQMVLGRRAVPPPVAAWLRRLAAFHAKAPPPEAWRTRPGLAAAPKDREKQKPESRQAAA